MENLETLLSKMVSEPAHQQARTRLQLTQAWKRSPPPARDQFLSLLKHRWSSNLDRMDQELPLLSFIDWTTHAHKKSPWWLNFVSYPPIWERWWSHRHSQVAQAATTWGGLTCLDVPNHQDLDPGRAQSLHNTAALLEKLPVMLGVLLLGTPVFAREPEPATPHHDDVPTNPLPVRVWSPPEQGLWRVITDAIDALQAQGIKDEDNPLLASIGISLMEWKIGDLRLFQRDFDDNVQIDYEQLPKEWRQELDVLWERSQLCLVHHRVSHQQAQWCGRPELLLERWWHEQDTCRQENILALLWASLEARWKHLPPAASKELFLPSSRAMQEQWKKQPRPAPDQQSKLAIMESIILSSSLGQWPGHDDPQRAAASRKRM